MSIKAAQQRGCAKRAFCGVCFLVAGGLKPGALVFVSGCGLLASGGVIASALAGLRSIINRRCYYFFLQLFNDGLFDFDDSGIGNGGYYNVGLLLRNLALKHSINMNIVNETVGVNKAGQDYKLSDYLQVKTLSQEASRIGDIFFALDRCFIGCYNAKSKKSYTNPTERSEYMGRNDRYFMSSVKIGPKGQIVIPKEARDMFGLEPGDTLVLMADKKKGLALQTVDKLNPLMKTVFNSLPSEDGEVDDE